MELHQLRYFVAVAETGSFSRGAAQCGIAQPSLSQQIKRLEESIGVRLFDRLGRTIALTDAGRLLLPEAQQIVRSVRVVREQIADNAEAGSGHLRVGAIPTMAPYLLPPALKRFRGARPTCGLTVREDLTPRLVDALVDCELDCAIMSTPIDHELIDVEVIDAEPLLVATSATYDLPRRAALTLADLRDKPTVVLHEMHCLGQQIQGFCAQRGVRQRIVCRGTQLMTVLELVGLGLGISLVPRMCAAADRSKARRYVPIGRNGPMREIALCWRRDRSRPVDAQAFAEALRAVIALQSAAT